MRILALLLSALILFQSCQKEPDETLPDRPSADSLTIKSFSPDTILIGMEIRIIGSGFDTTLTDNIVTVNGVQLNILSGNDTLLIAKIPDSATTGKIDVTVNGLTVSSTRDLVILDNPVPSENDIWVQKSDYNGSVGIEGPEYYNSFSLNGKGYYLKHDKLWEYSPETNNWTQKASIPSAKGNSYGFCFTIQNKAYVGLGGNGPGNDITEYKQVWEYNGNTNTWAQKKDFPGSQRVIPFSFSIGTNGYIGGGDTLNAGISGAQTFDFWKYESTTDTWTRMSDFPGTRALSLSGVSIGNDGFVVELGANNPTAPLTHYEDIYVWKYNPANNSWQKKAKLPTGGLSYDGGGTAFVINDKIYLGAGIYDSTEVNGQTIRKNFWMFDPVANSWINKKDIGGGLRLFGVGFAINGKGYIGLGTGATADEVKKDFWEYNP